jgi:phosphatidylserine/phosphatidylglycerophosphate/cardiolipin synthase-like enzyme
LWAFGAGVLWSPLREAGAEVRAFNPLPGCLSRDHRKTLVVDGVSVLSQATAIQVVVMDARNARWTRTRSCRKRERRRPHGL